MSDLHGDIHALSGAYAVDALDDLERARFVRHLADCQECRAEVDSLREAAATLSELTSLAPSDALRQRVLAEIATVRPLAPVVATPAATGATSSTRSPRPWLRGLVAAAAVVATLGAGGVTWDQLSGDDSGQVPSAISLADQVLGAPDAVTRTQKLAAGGEATVVASKSLNKMVVMTKDLPPLSDDQIYEMWINDAEKGSVKASLMTAEDATVVLDGDIRNAVGAGITVEPAGGSHVPTTEPIAEFSFENA